MIVLVESSEQWQLEVDNNYYTALTTLPPGSVLARGCPEDITSASMSISWQG